MQLPDYLDLEQRIATHLETMFQSLDHPVRAGELRNEWRDGRRSRWIDYVLAVTDRETLIDAFSRMDEFHVHDDVIVDAELFPARIRFNLEMHKLMRMVQGHDPGSEQEEQSRRELQRQADQVLSWLDQIDMPVARADEWRELLEEVVNFDPDADADADRGPDWDEVGPARAGWTWELIDDGELVQYRPPNEMIAEHGDLLGDDPVLIFRRVPGDNTDGPLATYMSTTEVSAGLFIAVAKAAGLEQVMYDHLIDRELIDPQLWTWRGRSMAIANGTWFAGQGLIENDIPSPSARFPMQNVTPAAAISMARQLGCRLPTESEWRAAAMNIVNTTGAIRANLLGQAIPDLQGRIEAHRRERPFDLISDPARSSWPEQFRRDLDGLADPDNDLFRSIQPQDVGWFARIEKRALAFEHLVGNVAEFVLTDRIDFEALDALPKAIDEPQAFLDALYSLAVPAGAAGEINLRFIGGSIFAGRGDHPLTRSLTYTRRRNIEDRRLHQQIYPDVGFRLAFASSAQLSPQQQFARLLTPILDEQQREPFLLARRD